MNNNLKIIIILLLLLWIISSISSSSSSRCSTNSSLGSIKSTFIIPQVERELMKKNMIYLYVRNPFMSDTNQNLIIETLRNQDDLTDRTKFSEIMTTYYNLQNQYYQLLNDINIVLKQIRNFYGIEDITKHDSVESVLDFSNFPAYTEILNELSSTTVANTKATFASTYDANIIPSKALGFESIKPGTTSIIDFEMNENIKTGMFVVNMTNSITLTDESYFKIISVSPGSNKTRMKLEIENKTNKNIVFNALPYDIIRRIGPPVITLTNFLYDQTIREDEIIVVFNNKMLSFSSDSFDPNVFLIRYSKNKPLTFEIPPYPNFRREQLMQLLYKNHF